MKIALPVLLAGIAMAGSPPMPPMPLLSPKDAANQAPQAAQAPRPPGTVLGIMPLKYDTNRFHDILISTDGKTWATTLKNCYGTPAGNIDLTNTTKQGLVKIVGHPGYTP